MKPGQIVIHLGQPRSFLARWAHCVIFFPDFAIRQLPTWVSRTQPSVPGRIAGGRRQSPGQDRLIKSGKDFIGEHDAGHGSKLRTACAIREVPCRGLSKRLAEHGDAPTGVFIPQLQRHRLHAVTLAQTLQRKDYMQLPTPAPEGHPNFVQQKTAHTSLAHANASSPIGLGGFIRGVGQHHFREAAQSGIARHGQMQVLHRCRHQFIEQGSNQPIFPPSRRVQLSNPSRLQQQLTQQWRYRNRATGFRKVRCGVRLDKQAITFRFSRPPGRVEQVSRYPYGALRRNDPDAVFDFAVEDAAHGID